MAEATVEGGTVRLQPSSRMIEILAVVGNPKVASRTRGLARELADTLAGRFDGATWAGVRSEVVDLGADPAGLLDGSDTLAAQVDAVARADLLLAVSPTYRATYTGLLKLFLDRLPAGALSGKVAIPVMVAAAPQHALAVDLHLRPVLLELGASCPTDGLFVLEDELSRPSGPILEWLARAAPQIDGALH